MSNSLDIANLVARILGITQYISLEYAYMACRINLIFRRNYFLLLSVPRVNFHSTVE